MSQATPENGWVNTTEGHNPAVIARARQILAGTIYGTLATSRPDGLPWASPIFFGYDAAWNLYWSSTLVAQHSQNLYANQGRAAIAIYSTDRSEGQGQGLYLSGTVAEVETAAVETVIPLLLQRSASGQRRTAADYLPPSPRRLYRFQPQTVWITGDRIALSDTILIDTKIQLDLSSLIATPDSGS
ncbi:pyridoxamine 5'-phosphate oxidase family protein [Phormidium sp. FACHB-1136]|uniref:pyridoxamine 5'-phosphate oxidase family protein n=1 Tax=Phormidium sp. FACHB-1136 TaxID=2692848 RepID=UPI001684F210|nr:pyridoxamine 5'-phosphate oxidase family protein [Phormidium sp. FACHB-1136]MBD2425848.1 pyridoxamine 5'-phosphate oxidase family protein [Phormidium sp. FACHB-1136]